MVSDELYDLEIDPGGFNNLINSPEHAAIRDGLHDRLLDWINPQRDSHSAAITGAGERGVPAFPRHGRTRNDPPA